jgi:two-component system, cell cycle response regulator DivK
MASASPRRDAPPPNRRAVVLLVDSHDDSRDMYAVYLRLCGFTVRTADTTDDGLSRADDVDVVVTEIHVPGSWDGVELVRQLRHSAATKRTPIIVLTACAFGSAQQRAEAAGCDRFLMKPCLPERLASELRPLITPRDTQNPAPPRTDETERQRRRASLMRTRPKVAR